MKTKSDTINKLTELGYKFIGMGTWAKEFHSEPFTMTMASGRTHTSPAEDWNLLYSYSDTTDAWTGHVPSIGYSLEEKTHEEIIWELEDQVLCGLA